MEPVAAEAALEATEAAELEALAAIDEALDAAEPETEEADDLPLASADEALPPAPPRMVVEPTMVEKVEPPEVTRPERAEVVIGDSEAEVVVVVAVAVAVPAPPPTPPTPEMVVEPMVDPPETMAEVVMAEEEATVVVAVVVETDVAVAVPEPPAPAPPVTVAQYSLPKAMTVEATAAPHAASEQSRIP